jgi:26S proteasome regulatory subunit N3
VLNSSAAGTRVHKFLSVLAVKLLLDAGDAECFEHARVASVRLIAWLCIDWKREESEFVGRAYFYFARAHELCGKTRECRGALLLAHRTAVLRRDDELQATLLNALLRSYLQFSEYDEADKLLKNTRVEEKQTSSSQFARYLYYKARVMSIRLEYREAHELFELALRKAPQVGAVGFRLVVAKWACVVQLLLGEIPLKATFRQAPLAGALLPYLGLAQAVRVGALQAFAECIDAHRAVFERDATLVLIGRLRASVIKAGLRKINSAYSRISLGDIAAKLHLESAQSAEFIVAKAIRDGVIDATIDHRRAIVESRKTVDVYSTAEPMQFFHEKIQFCLTMHNDAVRAMRYSPEILKQAQRTIASAEVEEDNASK